MIDINLLPSSQSKSFFALDKVFRVGLILLAIELVGIIAFDIAENSRINRLNTQIADWTQRVAVVQEQVKEVDDLRDKVADLRAKADLLERIKQSPIQVAEIISDIGHNTPHGVWYSTVTLVHVTDGGTVTLAGDTSSYREVADLMLNLDGSPVFGDAVLTTSTQQTSVASPAGGDVQFSVIGTLSPAVVGQ
ncbi:MAG: PilN domain-containing protein [Candidatus Eremiobacter antarcticus]|nr:PilN domain-containing protein [Candidatus Eremiobacteraeota bacterium]MBC5808893.1 PilN domain-containing protein [Candidatus Eremiobacteraeota bacterium]